MNNHAGKITAMTVFTPVKRGWTTPWLRPNFWLAQYLRPLNAPLRRLKFIHFLLLLIIDRIPQNGPPQPEEKLNYKYMLFESNFNGTWDQYIDAFSRIVASRMTMIWGSSYGFPGPVPVEPFKAYIERNEFVCNHYYCAYPEATLSMINGAFAVQERLERFVGETEAMGPEEFEAAYEGFLTAMQRHL